MARVAPLPPVPERGAVHLTELILAFGPARIRVGRDQREVLRAPQWRAALAARAHRHLDPPELAGVAKLGVAIARVARAALAKHADARAPQRAASPLERAEVAAAEEPQPEHAPRHEERQREQRLAERLRRGGGALAEPDQDAERRGGRVGCVHRGGLLRPYSSAGNSTS